MASSSLEKRQRAAAFQPRPGITPDTGQLNVRWESVFDRSCYLAATPELAINHPRPYRELMSQLREETGCSEAEILAHGAKVRTALRLAQEQLSRSGTLSALGSRQKHEFTLRPVRPAF